MIFLRIARTGGNSAVLHKYSVISRDQSVEQPLTYCGAVIKSPAYTLSGFMFSPQLRLPSMYNPFH
jgi:hypothetical protein